MSTSEHIMIFLFNMEIRLDKKTVNVVRLHLDNTLK